MSRRTTLLLVLLIAMVAVAIALFSAQRSPDEGDAVVAAPPAHSRPKPPVIDSKSEQVVESVVKLPFAQLVHRVDDVRRLADGGHGRAAWLMADFVARCANTPVQSDADALRQLQERRREELERRGDAAPPDELWQSLVEESLVYVAQHRVLCSHSLPGDQERVVTWLETALAHGEPELFRAMTVFSALPVPRNDSWLIRHAERVASFVGRAKAEFEARIAAGDRQLLGRAYVFYRNPQFWPEPDWYRSYVHAVAASHLTGDEYRFLPTPYAFEEYRRHLGEDELQRGRIEGDALFERCCAGPP